MSKKIFCLLIALLMLLTISCASAAEDLDNSTIETVDEQDAVQSTIDDVSLEIENDDAGGDVLSDPADSDGQAGSNLHFEVDIDDYGYVSINAIADPAATGELSIKITDAYDVEKTYMGQLENGRYTLGGLGFHLDRGQYSLNSHYYGDVIFAPVDCEMLFIVPKFVPEFNVDAFVNNYGAIIINATLFEFATGNVTFRLVREGEDPDLSTDVNVTVENGTAVFNELAPFNKGNYTVYATYSGNDYYFMAYSGPMGVEVNKTAIIPRTIDLDVDHNVVDFVVDLGVPATGSVHAVYSNGYEQFIQIDEDYGLVKLHTNINEHGPFSIVLDYDGDDNYYGFYEFNVDFFIKYDPELNVTTEVDNYGYIEIFFTVNKTATGIVLFEIKNSTGDVLFKNGARIVNGSANFTEVSQQYDKGNYIIEVIYQGDDMFQDASKSTNVVINKTYITPTIGNVTVKGRIGNFTVDLGVPATGVIRGIFYNGTVTQWPISDDNKVTSLITFDDCGPLYIILDYEGDNNYYGFEDYIDFFIKYDPELNVNPSVTDYGFIAVEARLNENATGEISVKIKNSTGDVVVEGTQNIENGYAVYYELTEYAKGTYTIEVSYPGDEYHEAATNSTQCEVTKTVPSMDYTVKVVGGEVTIVVTMPSDINGNLSVIYPSTYTEEVPIVNGSATIHSVFMNETGDMAITVIFFTNDQYYTTDAIIGFVIKQATMVDANAVSVVYQNNAKVTVKLTNLVTGKAVAGAPVEITLNGKTYKGTTDKNGNAVITIPAKMIPKKYTAKVAFKGSDTLEDDFTEFAFTVKKATPKVTAKKKTFKKSVKVKKYTITLKDNKGKAIKKAKVTIKVGKKTFKAKTNAKGKAVFKLKKLTKKAKYTAKVTYKGNNYFNKVTKKAKIIIK